MSMRRGALVGSTLLSLGLLAAACSSGGEQVDQADVAPPPGSESGPCPPNLVVQTDWFPEIEHGGLYQLIGPGGTVDTQGLTYSGALRNRYKGAHGVQTVEIRSGGGAVDNRSVTDLMYADNDIALGFVSTDDAVASRLAGRSVVGIAGTLDISPIMLMWSPARHTITQFPQLAKSRAPVLVFPGLAFVDYIVSEGFVTADQIDASYQGDPSRWLESNGTIIQEGYATNEAFQYENLIDGWKRPVDFFLIHWMGYENYPSVLSTTEERLAAGQGECLELLVPTLQQAWVDFLGDPEDVSQSIVSTVDAYGTFWRLTPELNERALEMFTQFEIATNGTDATYGNFDVARVQRLVEILRGVYGGRGTPLDPDLQASDVATNEFIDPTIGLPATTQ